MDPVDPTTARQGQALALVGRVISGIAVLFLLVDAGGKLLAPQVMIDTTPAVLLELNGPQTKLEPGSQVVFPNALPTSRALMAVPPTSTPSTAPPVRSATGSVSPTAGPRCGSQRLLDPGSANRAVRLRTSPGAGRRITGPAQTSGTG